MNSKIAYSMTDSEVLDARKKTKSSIYYQENVERNGITGDIVYQPDGSVEWVPRLSDAETYEALQEVGDGKTLKLVVDTDSECLEKAIETAKAGLMEKIESLLRTDVETRKIIRLAYSSHGLDPNTIFEDEDRKFESEPAETLSICDWTDDGRYAPREPEQARDSPLAIISDDGKILKKRPLGIV